MQVCYIIACVLLTLNAVRNVYFSQKTKAVSNFWNFELFIKTTLFQYVADHMPHNRAFVMIDLKGKVIFNYSISQTTPGC